jgi:hypothetical protein
MKTNSTASPDLDLPEGGVFAASSDLISTAPPPHPMPPMGAKDALEPWAALDGSSCPDAVAWSRGGLNE